MQATKKKTKAARAAKPDDSVNTWRTAIRRAATERKVTQEQMAEAAGVSQAAVSRFLSTGSTAIQMSSDHLCRLCEFVGLDLTSRNAAKRRARIARRRAAVAKLKGQPADSAAA